MIRVLIVEDQTMLLDGIANALSNSDEFEVKGKLKDIALASDFMRTYRVDVLLTDIYTDNKNNSLKYIASIKKEFPNTKIVVMTGLPEVSYAETAKNNGADSFIYKNVSLQEMKNVIKSTVNGYCIYPKPTDPPVHSFDNKLTKQEMKVLRLFCEGHDRREIGDILSISENSVKFHIKNILNKTNYSSMTRLAIYAISNKLIIVD